MVLAPAPPLDFAAVSPPLHRVRWNQQAFSDFRLLKQKPLTDCLAVHGLHPTIDAVLAHWDSAPAIMAYSVFLAPRPPDYDPAQIAIVGPILDAEVPSLHRQWLRTEDGRRLAVFLDECGNSDSAASLVAAGSGGGGGGGTLSGTGSGGAAAAGDERVPKREEPYVEAPPPATAATVVGAEGGQEAAEKEGREQPSDFEDVSISGDSSDDNEAEGPIDGPRPGLYVTPSRAHTLSGLPARRLKPVVAVGFGSMWNGLPATEQHRLFKECVGAAEMLQEHIHGMVVQCDPVTAALFTQEELSRAQVLTIGTAAPNGCVFPQVDIVVCRGDSNTTHAVRE
jgi:hypothetical protein